MESSKELSRLLQTEAKKFGYELKLTHCQELVAKLSGFKNRHALLASSPSEIKEKDEQTVKETPVISFEQMKADFLKRMDADSSQEKEHQYFVVQVGEIDPRGKNPYIAIDFPEGGMDEESVEKWVIEKRNLDSEDIFEVKEVHSETFKRHAKPMKRNFKIIVNEYSKNERMFVEELELEIHQESIEEELALEKALALQKLTAKEAKKANVDWICSEDEFNDIKSMLNGLDEKELKTKTIRFNKKDYADSLERIKKVVAKTVQKEYIHGLEVEEDSKNIYYKTGSSWNYSKLPALFAALKPYRK